MNRFINKEIYYSITLIVVPLSVVFGVYFYSAHESSNPNLQNVAPSSTFSSEKIEYTYEQSLFDSLEFEAKSVLVEKLNTGEILFEKNSSIAAPIASITKIMTALVVYENINDLNMEVSIPIEALSSYGTTQLRLGETFSFKDLLDLMLMTSSNHAAVAVSNIFESTFPNKDFINEMNILSKKIGLNNTYFLNETGLDENLNTAGSFSSAKDVSTLLKYIIKNHPQLFEKTKMNNYTIVSKTGYHHNITNTNSIVGKLPNMIASKTGYTDLAGGNLTIVIDPGLNDPISITVLGSTRLGRFEDVLKLTDSIYNK